MNPAIVFFLSLAWTGRTVIHAVEGRLHQPALLIGVSAELDLYALLGFLLTAFGVRLSRYRLRRVAELMGSDPEKPRI